ncbi:MAG TPA: hypothetical protein VGC41_03660 [Kofleriaceae bacterium]
MRVELHSLVRAVATGYRPHWRIGKIETTGTITLEARVELAPGERGFARLEPIEPAYWTGVRVGDELAMCEGSRVLGYARVVEIF